VQSTVSPEGSELRLLVPVSSRTEACTSAAAPESKTIRLLGTAA
jgi:hypothetical protein